MSKPQRRKGNAKTASSAQAADLLGTKGFVGFDIGFSNVFESVGSEFANLDNEVIVILKKMSKKDCQTREKALRELSDFISSQTLENIEGTFGYYVNAFPKLALDGSPTVRQLSLKCLALSIDKLKKAAEKHLKKLIPFVLICTCDLSLVVAGQAEELLRSCFPEEKSAKVVQLFSEDTARVCCDFITQQHTYFPPQKYDEEETALQRESRLLTECLYLLSRLADTSPEVATIAQELFNNPAQLKKFLTSASPQVHAGLLHLVQRLPSSFNFIDSPISQYSLSNLDNEDATVGTCCFNVLHLLISEHKEGSAESFVSSNFDFSFFKKFDVKKTLVPRLLTIVRKKASHWRYCGPYLLPSFAAIHGQLPEDEATTFGLNFLISFSDNMPFSNAAVTPSSWSTAFVECFMYFLTQVPAGSAEQTVPIAVNTMDKADLFLDTVQNDFVGLIRWICEKRSLSPPQITSFLNNLELNLMNLRPRTNPFIIQLFSLGLDELVNFHVDALQSAEVPTAFITTLENSPDRYFQKIFERVNLLPLLNNEEQQLTVSELKSLAVITLRVFKLSPNDENKVEFRHDLAVEVMKEKNSHKEEGDDINALMERLGLGVKDSAVFLTLLETSSKKNANIYVDILKSCDAHLRRDIMKTVLGTEDLHVVEFVFSAHEQIEWDNETEELMATWMWMEFFHLDNKNFEILGKGMETGKWEPPLNVVRDFMPVCCSDMPSSLEVPEIVRTDFHDSKDCLYLYSERFLRICDTQPHIYEAIIVSAEFLRYIIERADYLLAARETSLRSPLVESPAPLPTDISIEDVTDFVDRLAHAVSLYVALLRTDKYSREVQKETLALFQVVDAYLGLINNTEYLRHKHNRMSELIKEFFQAKTFRVSDVLDLLVKEPVKNSSIVHAALQNIHRQYPDFTKELEKKAGEDLPLSICWALKMDLSRRKMGVAERFITRFYCEDTPLELISHLHDYCSQEGSTWHEDARLFSAKAKDPYMWQLNVLVLKTAIAVISTKFETIKPEQLDFIMCGLVSTFESLDDIYANKEQLTAATEALLGNALVMFRVCCETHARLGSLVFSEWKEFYYPFMTRVIVRIWSKMSTTTTSPTTLPLLEICRAVYNLKEIPADLDLYEEDAVEEYKYEPHISTLICRCVRGLQSGFYLDQFASLKILTLLAPKLFRLENGEWNEEEVVSKSGPKRLVVPEPFTRITESKTLRGFIRFAALRAALEPLMSDELAEEEKLLYCESFPPLVNAVLPELIQTHSELVVNPAPESLLQSVADYLLSIITDLCSLVPAVVRSWYNGLPKQASFIVNKFVSENVSRTILTNELNKVKEEYQKIKKGNEMKVSIVRVARQIVAEYVVDETKMVLTITMPENFPLGVPEIDLEKACVPTPRAKKWLLQLTAYLFYQNGSIINGIQMWKKNVDKDVEGAEACCICMYTIHSNTHQLPRVICKQCKNKFHAACLYKWFESSNNTQCPLCRTTFT